ncbi:hypothetical protein IQN75_00760 [Elizabethkingia anophelis]|uniref:hypothetical protein n=1 Tax=Elizabethkingia anophelis TaxID=1117645 RepID=UPI001880C49A|nr:hypothetical protein [Elizabethkingia anophelis]MBE9391944.1 hypothetical protein [Elizabethkingia anophelis]MBE9405384.1 hypothetical protein [Elizabethkingia anophelis]MDV3897725.1 hypothetical protein [Elizabethkingia anophelis]
MEEIKINAQPEIIKKIQTALKDCSIGIGIATKTNITVKTITTDSRTIIFSPKMGKEISAKDLFWLGYFVGRDY